MCGIGGIFNIDKKPVNAPLLQRMGQVIRHRGPDDEGYLLVHTPSNRSLHAYGEESTEAVKRSAHPLVNDFQANLGLAFRRLSILDLSEKGHQPMSNPQGTVWIVFNGEVYNYVELRTELEKEGAVFRSGSDTEVVLNAYLHWGPQCLQRFVGMWAFAIWDGEKRQLFCSRDRFGIKPFYYAFDGQSFLFGSEVKQLLVHPIDRTLREDVIFKSLIITSYLVNSNNTYYQSVHILPHGHYLLVDADGLRIQQYYDLDFNTFATFSGSFDSAVEAYRHHFSEAVRLHMRSDVEVGITLSGGLDSTAILAMAHQETPRTLQTFTSYFTDAPRYDERQWIAQVLERYPVNPHFYSTPPSEVMDGLAEMTRIHDYPIPGSSVVANYFLMKKIKQAGVTVILAGQGADEIAAGYNGGFFRYFASLLRSGQFGKFAAEYPTYFSQIKKDSALAKLVKLLLVTCFKESFLYQFEAKFNIRNPLSIHYNEFEVLDNIKDLPTDKLSNYLYNLMMSTSIQTLQHYEDRNSMASSVETRVPFLDHRLVEFVFSLPLDYKMYKSQRKRIHREAMRGYIPDEILDRKEKNGYLAPGEQFWLKNEMKGFLAAILSSQAFRERGIYNLKVVDEEYKKFLQGNMGYAQTLWNIMALELWFQNQSKP